MSSGSKSFLEGSVTQVLESQGGVREIKGNVLEVRGLEEQGEYFKVDSVLERREDIEGVIWYLVRWASREEGRQVWEESWTEEGNLGTGLKEEFEENEKRRMEEKRGSGGGGDQGGKGERIKTKRMRIDKEGDSGEGEWVLCTVEGCGKSFTNAKSLKIHLKRWGHPRINLSGRLAVVSSDVGGGGDGGGEVEEDEGQPPVVPLVEGGDDVGALQVITVAEENGQEEVDEMSALPSVSSLSSGGGGDGRHVEDGEVPGTSASTSVIRQSKREVKVERLSGGDNGTPRRKGFDRKSLDAWADAQREIFRQVESQLEMETNCRRNAQRELAEVLSRNWNLEKKLKEEETRRKTAENERRMMEGILKDEKERRKTAENERRMMEGILKDEKERRKTAENERRMMEGMLKDEEERRTKVEEDFQRKSGQMAKFLEGFTKLEGMAVKIRGDFGGK